MIMMKATVALMANGHNDRRGGLNRIQSQHYSIWKLATSCLSKMSIPRASGTKAIPSLNEKMHDFPTWDDGQRMAIEC